ncbi:MAG: fumarate hydratase [Candidatus Asgardarchaeia archaeon]
MSLKELVDDAIFKAIIRAETSLPQGVKERILEMGEEFKDGLCGIQLRAICENVEMAEKSKRPICQDTGMFTFFVKLGEDFPIRYGLRDIIISALRKATKELPLRPNCVDIFRGSSGDNVGFRGNVPYVHWEVVPGDSLEVVVMPKGGGCSNVSKLFMLNPSDGLDGVKRAVLDTVFEAGAKACPPYVVGVGIGGDEVACMNLAKKALIRGIGKRSEDPKVSRLEDELKEILNGLEIGVMGLGEGPTVLEVNLEVGCRHPATLPVGVVISCWALRYSRIMVNKRGDVHFLT